MSQAMQLYLKSSFLDRRRQLVLDPDYIEFDDNDVVSAIPTRFEKMEIVSFRYGVKWIKGYSFYIGRIYCIDIKSATDKVIKIKLKSLYGVNKKLLNDKYSRIVHGLFDLYFKDISIAYLENFNEGHSFRILDTTFTPEGLSWEKSQSVIPWDDVDLKAFSTYFSLFSKSNPSNYKAYEYLTDWNAGMLYSISTHILRVNEKNA